MKYFFLFSLFLLVPILKADLAHKEESIDTFTSINKLEKSDMSKTNTLQDCPFSIVTTVRPPTCFGGNDGTITIKLSTSVIGVTVSIAPAATIITVDATTFLAINLASGPYTITVSTNDCSEVLFVTVPEPTPLQATFTVGRACPGSTDGTITVTNVTGGLGGTYELSVDGGPSQIFPPVFPQTEVVFSGLTAGVHTLTIVDTFSGCRQDIRVVVCPCLVRKNKRSKRLYKVAKAIALANYNRTSTTGPA